jgi:UDPglucose 6-dehydrogenase
LPDHECGAIASQLPNREAMMKIAMIGAGYVGLTTGACLAQLGHSVTGVDIDIERIRGLTRGEVPIYEPGLEVLVRQQMQEGRLRFSADLAASVGDADAIFLAVGTPSGPSGDIDLRYVQRAASDIAPAIKPNAVVVLKSTVVVGTCRRVREVVAERRGGLDFSVASNPEFLREGSAIEDFLCPDRIVVGADDQRAARLLERLYAPLRRKGVPFIKTSTANAELIKYAANAFLALKIGFINDVANLCEAAGGDVTAVAEGIGLDRRIGTAFLAAGPGFGGSCFPKDTRAFAATGRRLGAPQALVETLIERNQERKKGLARRILHELQGEHATRRVAVLGVAFKANTDDARESAALTIVPMLQEAGVTVAVHDPQAREQSAGLLPGVAWHDTPYAAAADAEAVVILTDWDEYRRLDLKRLARLMAGRTIFDFRNLLPAQEPARYGLRCIGIGRSDGQASNEPGVTITRAAATRQPAASPSLA